MLAIEYALKYQKHLKGLVLSSMTASIASYVEYVNKLRAALPPEVLAVLVKYEEKGDYENPEYQAVMFKEVYGRHVCRVDPWPDPVARAFKHITPQVYNTMQGPNEFVVTGTFKDWDRWKDLAKITVPTLVIGARYDEMNPDDIRKMGKLLPNSRVAICENGSHLAMWDDQEAYFAALWELLSRSAEADPSVAVSAYYGGDRRGPKISFRIPSGPARETGEIKSASIAIGRG
jgi:proline iminopeptidase